MTRAGFMPWGVAAVNLPEHAGNPIHTDAGARAAGYPSALVAGVTVYAYLAHLPAARWGFDWVREGGAEVRFVRPVFAGDRLDCVGFDDAEGGRSVVEAHVGDECRAYATVTSRTTDRTVARPGDALAEMGVVLDEQWSTYAQRAGDDLRLYQRERVVHPAAWVALANRITHAQVADGPWIHVRSRISHRSAAAIGAFATVDARVVDRFASQAGQRAILDVTISVDGEPVVDIEHEAIVALG